MPWWREVTDATSGPTYLRVCAEPLALSFPVTVTWNPCVKMASPHHGYIAWITKSLQGQLLWRGVQITDFVCMRIKRPCVISQKTYRVYLLCSIIKTILINTSVVRYTSPLGSFLFITPIWMGPASYWKLACKGEKPAEVTCTIVCDLWHQTPSPQ